MKLNTIVKLLLCPLAVFPFVWLPSAVLFSILGAFLFIHPPSSHAQLPPKCTSLYIIASVLWQWFLLFCCLYVVGLCMFLFSLSPRNQPPRPYLNHHATNLIQTVLQLYPAHKWPWPLLVLLHIAYQRYGRRVPPTRLRYWPRLGILRLTDVLHHVRTAHALQCEHATSGIVRTACLIWWLVLDATKVYLGWKHVLVGPTYLHLYLICCSISPGCVMLAPLTLQFVYTSKYFALMVCVVLEICDLLMLKGDAWWPIRLVVYQVFCMMYPALFEIPSCLKHSWNIRAFDWHWVTHTLLPLALLLCFARQQLRTEKSTAVPTTMSKPTAISRVRKDI